MHIYIYMHTARHSSSPISDCYFVGAVPGVYQSSRVNYADSRVSDPKYLFSCIDLAAEKTALWVLHSRRV